MNKKLNILVTGTTKGLGKFLSRELDSECFGRDSKIEDFQKKREPYDAIIHCAFERAGRKVTNENLYSYLNSSLQLTKNILSIPHKQFFYCSTVDVYPLDDKKNWAEEDVIVLDTFHNLYGFIKLCCESVVLAEARNPVIMRLAAMLGKDIQPNGLMKALLKLTDRVGLSKESTFNYILHKDVLAFIKKAMAEAQSGCFNLVANENITFGNIIDKIESNIQCGDFTYLTGNISNSKIKLSAPEFAKTSEENIKIFCDELGIRL